MERTISLAKTKGAVGLIVPDVWLTNTYSSVTRNFIFKQSSNLMLTKPPSDVFEGIVVDTVSEVLNIKGNEIEETPSFWANMETNYILGMAKMNGGVKILLDIDKVLSAEELEILDKAA